MQPNPDVYFANLPTEEIGTAIMQRVDDYFTFLVRSGLLQLWRSSYKAYYMSEIAGGQVQPSGAQNEYSNINVNHGRSVMTTLKGMIGEQKIVFDSKATNTDTKSQAQAILSNGLLEYYTKEKGLEAEADLGLEYACVLSEGWILTTWDPDAGEVYSVNPDNDSPIYEGDLKYNCYLPNQIVRDCNILKFKDNQWFIPIDFVNKWDLMAQFPEHAERIQQVSLTPDARSRYFLGNNYRTDIDRDLIPVFTLYHKRTRACPEGRICIVLDEDTVLTPPGALPYHDVPLRCIRTSPHIAWNFGYTSFYDVMVAQNALNIIDSVVLTNFSTYGVQNVLAPRGANVSASSLAGGLNLIEYDTVEGVQGGGVPSGLNLTTMPNGWSEYRSIVMNDIQLLSGINSVSRGDVASLGKSMSGSAMALLQNMALQYANALQKSYVRTLSEVGTDSIMILRDFAKVKRVAMIAGIANRPYMKEFTGDDLSMVNRVSCEIGNPLAQSVAGRSEIAKDYIAQGWASSPEEYTQVMTTGRLEPLIQGPQRINLQIRQENENLTEGKPVIAMVTDLHVAHIIHHSSILDGLDARFDPALVKRVTDHIMEHMEILQTANPALLAILKQPSLQQPVGMPPGSPSPGGIPPPTDGSPTAGVPPPNLPKLPAELNQQ